MIINKETIASATGTIVSAIGTSMQPDELLRYISLGLTILGAMVTLVTAVWNLAVKIKAWHKRAMEDGKIDDDEKEELKAIVKEGINEGKQALDTIKDATKKKGGK